MEWRDHCSAHRDRGFDDYCGFHVGHGICSGAVIIRILVVVVGALLYPGERLLVVV